MISKFIQTSVVAAALALGGSAFAQGGNATPNAPDTQKPEAAQPNKDNAQAPQKEQAAAADKVKSVRLTALDPDQLKAVQTNLKDSGFYKGKIDGALGNETRGALAAYFQQQAAMAQQGRISDAALTGFGFDKNQIEKVRGIDEAKGNARENTKGQETKPMQPKQEPKTQPAAPEQKK